MPQIRKIFLLARPIQLLFSLLAYGFGLGLARYLGATLLSEPQFLGGVIIILLLAASSLLTEYFRPPNEPIIPNETRLEREQLRPFLLTVSITFIATSATLVFLLNRDGFMRVEAIFVLAILVLLALISAVPPFRLANRGLGELSVSIQIACLSPTLAFLLQFGSLHRLLTIYTIPMLFLSLAYFLALNFPAYAEDLKYERKSLLIALSWQSAVPIHNALLFGAYLFFAAIPFLGVPFELVWPALLTLPIAAYQVFTLHNVAEGGKPIWSIFVATSTVTFGFTIYLIALTFWLR